MLVKRLEHVPIYLQPFLRYSKLLVENCDIFTPHLGLAAPQGVTPSEFREDLDIHKTRMNALSCGEEIMTMRSAVFIQCDGRTDRQTYGRTDGRPAYIYHPSLFQTSKSIENKNKKTIHIYNEKRS